MIVLNLTLSLLTCKILMAYTFYHRVLRHRWKHHRLMRNAKRRPPRPVFRKEESVEMRDAKPFILRYGQTVQVVSFVDGVATLARRNGFIEASSRQLVKSEYISLNLSATLYLLVSSHCRPHLISFSW